MSLKPFIIIGIIVGSTIGGFIPSLWGDNSLLSISSILGNFIGGLLGIWVGNWIYKNYF